VHHQVARSSIAALVFVAAALTACSSSSSDPVDLNQDDGGGLGDTTATTDGGSDPKDTDFHVDEATPDGASDTTGPTSSTLTATIRDFKVYAASDPNTDPDFENVPPDGTSGPWDDREIVTDVLGSDGKPVYKSSTKTVTTHGKDAFDKWFRDVPSVNFVVHYPIVLTPGADGSFNYDSEKTGIALSASDPTKNFFPIDDGTPYATPFGNQGSPHNYSFTVELHTTFVYHGGEFFSFRRRRRLRLHRFQARHRSRRHPWAGDSRRASRHARAHQGHRPHARLLLRRAPRDGLQHLVLDYARFEAWRDSIVTRTKCARA